MIFQGGGKQDDVSVRKSIREIEFIVPSENQIEIEAFGCGAAEVADEAGVGLVADLPAELFIFIEDFCSNYSYIAHL